MKQILLGLFSALFVVAVPLCIFSASAVTAIFDPSFYTQQEVGAGVPETYGLPSTVLAPVNEGMVRYFAGEFATLPDAFRASGADPTFFDERDLEHMVDVRTLFQQVALVEKATLAFGLTFLIVSYLVLGTTAVRQDGTLLLVGAGVALAIFVVGGALWLFAPSAIFLGFHEIYFSNDFWQLDPSTSHLIQIVPFPFWEAAITIVISRAVAITAATGVIGGLLAWFSGRLR